MRVMALALGLVLPGPAGAVSQSPVLEFEGTRFAAAAAPQTPPARPQAPIFRLDQWSFNYTKHEWLTKKGWIYFHDASGGRQSWGLKFLEHKRTRLSNVAIYVNECDLRRMPNIDLWVDGWGRMHYMSVLRDQVDYNCLMERDSKRALYC